MNKKKITLTIAVVILPMIMILMACGCQKNPASVVETTAAPTKPLETEIPVTTGPGVAYNEFGEPDFETTEPVEETKEETASTESTEADAEETTAPTEGETQPTAAAMTDYERYLSMSGDEQTAFIESFESVEAFFAWLNNAQAEHEAQKPGVDVGDGTIDLGGLAGGNG